MRMFSLVVVATLVALPLAAQQPAASQFSEQLDVNVVLVDAIVTDSTGHQILGLDKDDFTVKENGVAQPIDSVDYFTNRKLVTSPEDQAKFKAQQVKEERYYVLFFDKPSAPLLMDQLSLARSNANEWIRTQLKPSDRVAIVGHDVRLKVYCDFTSDKAQLSKGLDAAWSFGLGLSKADAPANGPSILRAIDAKKMVSRTGTVYEALGVLAGALRGIQARKDVVLFSPGIREPGEIVRGGVPLSTSTYYDPMIHALNAANVTVYALQLQKTPSEAPVVHQTLERITADTNGEYFRYNTSFTNALKRVENETNGYYLLTYHAHHAKGTKGYQKIDVSVRNPEFKVKAREGYEFGE